MTLYHQLADDIAAQIRAGILRAGTRLPSVRALRADRRLSPATIQHAYALLEARGYLEARPRSGYYVSAAWVPEPAQPRARKPASGAAPLDVSELVFTILEAIRDRDVVPLGSAFPSPRYFPLERLARQLGTSARRLDPWATVQDLPPGSLDLRRQIARRYLRCGARVPAEEIVITSGAMEGLNVALGALTQPGDIVVIESPAFYGCLQAVEAHGLRAIEVPTDPANGVDLAALDRALDRHSVKACWLMTSFHNPVGACVPDGARKELMRILERHDVPLIEDNVYAELYFGDRRPAPMKAFDRKGLVLDCGSFSKSLAPGYRVGWVAAGRYAQTVARRKAMASLATNVPAQAAIAAYLAGGGYDRFLRGLRLRLRDGQAAALASLQRHLPPGYRVTRPEGGYFLWVEFPEGVDAVALHRSALASGISIAPGPIFSARRGFGNCIRLNYGHPWGRKAEGAVAALAAILRAGAGGN